MTQDDQYTRIAVFAAYGAAYGASGYFDDLLNGDVARDCDVELDGRTEWCGPGIWCADGAPLVDNCRIEAGEWNNDCLRISTDAAGSTVRDTRIVNDADHRAVVIRDRGSEVETQPTRLVNVDIEHAGRSNGYAIGNFRPDVEFDDGHWRGGSARSTRHPLVSNPRCRVRGTCIVTDGAGALFRGAGTSVDAAEFRGGEIHVARDAPDDFRSSGRCVDVEISAPDQIEDLIRGGGGGSGNW